MISKLGKSQKSTEDKSLTQDIKDRLAGTPVPVAALAGMGAANVSGVVPQELAGYTFIRATRKAPTASLLDLYKVRKAMNVPDNVVVDLDTLSNVTRSFYNPKRKKIYTGRDLAIAAHEMGHASGPIRNDIIRRVFVVPTVVNNSSLLRKLTSMGELRRGYKEELSRLTGEKDTSSLGSAEDTALTVNKYLSRVSKAMQLGEEGQASLRALNAIRKVKGGGAALRAAKQLLPAWLTYAAGAAPLLLAPQVGKYVARFEYNRNKDKDE